MELLFLGVGEACDPVRYNTSILVKDAGVSPVSLLLDCGFTTPHRYFHHCDDPEELHILWISHFHGDHFFGVPLLLLRLWEMGRRSVLTILGPAEVKGKVLEAMELAYPGSAAKLGFSLDFRPLRPGDKLVVAGLEWGCAPCDHSAAALAASVRIGKKRLFYSGDGRPTSQSRHLAAGCDVIIHEAFRYDGSTPGHGSVTGSIEFAEQAGAGMLLLVHMKRDDRRRLGRQIQDMASRYEGLQVLLPEPGDRITF